MKTCKIILYDEPTVPEIRLERLEKFISEIFTIEIETRENIFQYSSENISEKIAGCRIFDLKKPFEKTQSFGRSHTNRKRKQRHVRERRNDTV